MSPRRSDPSRTEAILARAEQGDTLQSIADDYGISRERVRQILAAKGGPSGHELRSLRRDRDRAAIAAALETRSYGSTEDVAFATGLTTSRVDELAGEHKSLLIHERPAPKKYTDQDILDAIQEAAAEVGGPLSAAAYVQSGRRPSAQTIVNRFSSWNRACTAAGVEAWTATRGYESRWADEELLQFLITYLSEPSSRGTASEYQVWRDGSDPDAPSASTIVKRFGTWATAKRLAYQFD